MTTYKDAVGTNIGENVILGKTPTFSGWTVDPAGDVDRLTDGSLATAMTSGSKDVGAGGWEYAYIDFAVPNGLYTVGGFGKIICAASNGFVYIKSSSGKMANTSSVAEQNAFFTPVLVYVDDGVIRVGLTASGGSTVTPSFNELWAVRLS